MAYNVLILGASYGSLLASKLLLAGHSVTLACSRDEADLINAEGFRVWMPVRGRKDPVEIDSRNLPGKASAKAPADVDPKDFDLVVLTYQEPQYGLPGAREFLEAVAKSGKPCMAAMNMPPLAFMRRIPGLNHDALKAAYTDPSVWDGFDPGTLSLCSPDAQAIRPPEEKPNVLQVTLPTNLKAAGFDDDGSTAILRQLEDDIAAIRFDVAEGAIELPVKLKVQESLFGALAKWPMLVTGNYRCVTEDGVRTAQEAVHSDLDESRSVYEFVNGVCMKLGAASSDLVPFEKYAAAAQSLSRPAAAARLLNSGEPNIERVDKLVQLTAAQLGLSHPVVDGIVALIDKRLERNRASAGAQA
jgi:hypothetical protein